MILPPELLLDALAGNRLPSLWRSVSELGRALELLNTATMTPDPLVGDGVHLLRSPDAVSRPVDVWTGTGIMLVGIRLPGVSRASSLPVRLHVEIVVDGWLSGHTYFDGTTEWSEPAVLIPIPHVSRFGINVHSERKKDFPVQCRTAEFWGWQLAADFWKWR